VIALALLLVQTPAPSRAAPTRADEDARAKAAFQALSAGERKEFLEYLELELRQAGGFQNELVRFVLRADGRAPADIPAATDAGWYDPATHAPGQPIARHALAADDPALVAARRELLAGEPARALVAGFRYDYGRREVVRLAGWDDGQRVFANALAGYAPGLDLAQALVEKALDDGLQQKPLAAFAHTYTDRAGRAFTGITLLDAWSSGAELEMPDVDTLGILHELRDDWTSYKAPVPESQHARLYKVIGDAFRDASRHRGLRHALAIAYLEGQPDLGLYNGLLVNLHLVWEEAHSVPAELAPTLPSVARREKWMEKLVERGKSSVELWHAAELRRDTLAAAGDALRATLLAGLHEFGAYKKLESPEKQDH
jgi:hypothetical protein